jgi:hypothetical protein
VCSWQFPYGKNFVALFLNLRKSSEHYLYQWSTQLTVVGDILSEVVSGGYAIAGKVVKIGDTVYGAAICRNLEITNYKKT